MAAREDAPSVAAFRQVHGIERNHVRDLRARLKPHGVGQEMGRKLVTRPHKHVVDLLLPDELRNFYDDQDITPTDKMVSLFAGFLRNGLKGSVNGRERVPLLPAALLALDYEEGNHGLFVARSEDALAQRRRVKELTPVFFNRQPEDVSPDVWFEDEVIVGVLAARTWRRCPEELEALTTIESALRAEGADLTQTKTIPATVGIGGLETEVVYPD